MMKANLSRHQRVFFFLVLFGLCGFALMQCRATRDRNAQSLAAKDSVIYGSWFRSFEDETGGSQRVYRPSSYKFPPARGREGLNILSEGKVMYRAIAPTDGLIDLPGTWGWSGKQTLRINLENGRQFTYQIDKINREMMSGRWEEN